MIDLGSWNLSIPVGSPPTTIDTAKLVRGYDGKYFESHSEQIFFWAPVTGTKTANAKFPRSELRETRADGTPHNWLYSAADNYLRASLAVNQVPSSGKIVIGQIHTKSSTRPMLKVEYQFKQKTQSGNIVAKVRQRFEDKTARVITIAEGVDLNERFRYIIHLSPGGELSVSARGMNWRTSVGASWGDKPLYFKAGVYTQDNSGYTTEGGKATFYKLKIAHK